MEVLQTDGPRHGSLLSVNTAGEVTCVMNSFEAMEAAIGRLEGELAQLRKGLGEVRGTVASAAQVEAMVSTDARPGLGHGIADPTAKRMLREVDEAMRQQAEALSMMEQTVQGFPRRWSRFEVNTDRRKTLILDLKSRRENRPSLLAEVSFTRLSR